MSLTKLWRLIATDDDGKDLNMQHLLLLDALVGREQPLSTVAVSVILDLSRFHVANLAKRMVEAGFIERNVDPDDARRQTLAPTDKGRRLADRVNSYIVLASVGSSALITTETHPS